MEEKKQLECSVWEGEISFFLLQKEGMEEKKRRVWIFKIQDPQGIYGLGEAAPYAGLHRETSKEILQWLKKMDSKFFPLTDFYEPKTMLEIPTSLEFALETALLSYSYKKGTSSKYFSIFPSNIHLKEEITSHGLLYPFAYNRFYSSKIQVYKVKVGRKKAKEEIEWLERFLDNKESPIRFRLDGNKGICLKEWLKEKKSLSRLPIEYFEDPAASMEENRILWEETGIPQALDLNPLQAGKFPTEEFWQTLPGSTRFLILKPHLFGSLRATQKWIKESQNDGRDLVLSSLFDSPLSFFSYLLLASLCKGRIHGLSTLPFVKTPYLEKDWKNHNGIFNFKEFWNYYESLDITTGHTKPVAKFWL